MSTTIRPAFSKWPEYNRRLRFAIVERALDTWTLDSLDEEIRRTFGGEEWVHTRGSVIQRVFSHDVWHAAEINESLARHGLPQIDLWD